MDDRELLRARIVSASMDLDKAEAALAVYEPKKAAIKATWGALRNQLLGQRKQIDGLDEGLPTSPLEVSWSRLARVQAELKATTKEILALLQGGALRDAEQDGGVYSLADALVKEVAAAMGKPWAGLILPGEREFVNPQSSLIRLAFPQVSIWDLPIALHEYGHLAAPEIQDEEGFRPFALKLKATPSATARAHVTELFADMFAAYTCGPAFACTLILLRFDPTAEEATEDQASHPSHERRVALVLRVLKEQSGEIDDTRWDSICQDLSAAWRSTLEVSRTPSADEDGEGAKNKVGPGADDAELFSKLYMIVGRVPNARYESWGRARRLARQLRPDDGDDRGLRPDEETTIRDVLNAAWLARLNFPSDWFSIGVRAEWVIRKVAR